MSAGAAADRLHYGVRGASGYTLLTASTAGHLLVHRLGRSPWMIAVPQPNPPELTFPAPKPGAAAGQSVQPSGGRAVGEQVAADEANAFGEEALLPVDGIVRESPPWLLSAVLHMTALILFGLWWSVLPADERPLALDANYSESLGEQLIEEELALDEEPVLELEDQAVVLEPLPTMEQPLALPDLAALSPVGLLAASDKPSQFIGVALSGREPGMREGLLAAFGGDATTEQAVMAGLDWLVRNQKSTGGWSLRGPYSDGANAENAEAATAMALLAFQGRGFTHRGNAGDKYTQAVERGWRRLLKSQDSDGMFFRDGPDHHRFYTQAQCTIALCELFAMTQDEELRDLAQAAVDYLVKTQASPGGWKYVPGRGSDLSVTGWVVMALQSARMAGIEVPSPVFPRINKFLDSVAREGGSRYSYERRGGPRLPMTAEGLLCRQYLGWKHDDARLNNGVARLVKNPPKWRGGRDAYYWYYATQVCHHMEGDAWRAWNKVMKQVLPENQVKQGRERGSWTPRGDRHGPSGGRLYVTCLSIYSLEVYYRHLPIYRKGLLTGGY